MTTDTPVARLSTAADEVVRLGILALDFGRVDRITFHQDGETLESDTDHTVMLGLIACNFAAHYLPWLDLGLIAQYALVHDLVEVYAGDTPTLRIDDDVRAAKAAREAAALERLCTEFPHLSWVTETIRRYEERTDPEARYVKAFDKLAPKITHILNGGVTLHRTGMDRTELQARYDDQRKELHGYAGDFGPLMHLRDELAALVVELAEATP